MNDDEEILQKIWELSGKTERLSKLQKSGSTVTVKLKLINMKHFLNKEV